MACRFRGFQLYSASWWIVKPLGLRPTAVELLVPAEAGLLYITRSPWAEQIGCSRPH